MGKQVGRSADGRGRILVGLEAAPVSTGTRSKAEAGDTCPDEEEAAGRPGAQLESAVPRDVGTCAGGSREAAPDHLAAASRGRDARGHTTNYYFFAVTGATGVSVPNATSIGFLFDCTRRS